jgi:SagB-type dehydrogenase family enzyme
MPEKRLELPQPDVGKNEEMGKPLELVIASRRSGRRYTSRELTDEQVGQLLWAAQGITGKSSRRRAAPSAGGRHPLYLYVCRADGTWRYEPSGHSLVLHTEPDSRSPLARAAWNQDFIAQAPCVFVFSADFEKTTEKYGNRGRTRYVPMDAGHSAQNLLLQAVSLGLVGVPIGAFDDAAVRQALALPGNQEPLYILPVGYPP